MANTYYDSQLTAAEIEAALEAIDGILTPANNGKVLAISDGKFEARSVQWGGGGSAVLEPLSVTANGDYTPEAGVDGFDEVHVSVPNSYSASDEGKVVSNGALVAQTARSSQITQNGTYDTTLNNEVTVNVPGSSAVVQPLSVAQNGTYNPPSGVDGYAPVTVNVSGGGGGGGTQGFELYGAGFVGYTQIFIGKIDNNYLSCCFHDNMSPDYELNGVTERFSSSCAGKGSALIYATTKAVSNNTPVGLNALFEHLGSVLKSTHYDAGSYMSVVGGWVGYPTGGAVYENAVSNGAQNSITMNSAHQKLLIFIAGSANGLTGTTVEINGTTFNMTNMGTKYDSVYSAYAAIEVNNNTDTTITVTFPSACYNYVSIIGLDS